MIVPATESDMPELARMLHDLNDWHVPHAPHRLHGDGTALSRAGFFRDALARGNRVLVYRTEGVARGYLMWAIQDRPADAVCRPLRCAVLDHIYVEPVWRRRGLAGRLIARFEADSRAEGCTGWVTQVFAANVTSRALMTGLGAALVVETLEKRYDR